MLDLIVPNSDKFYGRVRACRSGNGRCWEPATEWKRNTIVFEWGAIIGPLLTLGERKYRIGGMYLEFENVVSPGTPVTIPTYDRTRSIAYYNSLSGSARRDYLRVPIIASTFESSNAEQFPNGNLPTFLARSQGVQGVHGKQFGVSYNSVVFGASLVAMVDEADATQDLIFSTFYFDTADQQAVLPTSQLGIDWELTLG